MSTTITDKAGLQAMENTLDGDFVLGANIDASGAAFTPVGDSSTKFTGTFDGASYTITGLNCSTVADYAGLFGYTNGATISDVTLASFDITAGDDYAGALVGYANNTVISDITITSPTVTVTDDYGGGAIGYSYGCTISTVVMTGGTITGGGHYAGGVIGYSSGDDIDNCYSTATVNGADLYTGGFAGYGYGSDFSTCYATGDVTASDVYAAGFIGRDESSTFTKCYATGNVSGVYGIAGFIGAFSGSTISKCYATGNVTATEGTNGLAGGFAARTLATGGSITDCYAMGTVDCDDVSDFDMVGGFIGYLQASCTVTNCYSTGAPTGDDDVGGFCGSNAGTIATSYWDTETSGTETTDGGIGKTTTQMQTSSTYIDWDFTCIWNINICLNSGYPYFRWTAADGGGETRTYTLPPIYDEKGRIPKGATARAYRSDTGALVETETLDSSGKATFTELPNDTDVSIHITWGGTTTTHKTVQIQSTIMGVTEGGTGASDEYNARSNLGLGSEDSPHFTAVNLGHATDTTIARAAAGRATIEGVGVVRGPASATDNRLAKFNLTTGDLIQQTGITADDSNNVSGVAKLTTSSDVELGHASDTTIHRESAGKVSVEGTVIVRPANYVVAATGAPTHVKAQADYVCDGTDDHVQILAAIDALPATGGKVLLTEGTFTNEAAIVLDSYQTLQGMGRNTILTTTTADLDIITATGGSGTEKVGILLADFCIDGDAGSATNDEGILWTYVDNSEIRNVWSIDNGESGIDLVTSDQNLIIGTNCHDNSSSGICLDNSVDNRLSGNICTGNTYGIQSYWADTNSILGNTCKTNTVGIMLDTADYCVVAVNTVIQNSTDGIHLCTGNHNTIEANFCTESSQGADDTHDDITVEDNANYNNVQGNTCRAGGETNKPKYGININGATCDGNKVINNDLYDDGFVTAPYSDSGTGTIYVEPGIDDTPVNGETGQPISSNWAFDHNAAPLGSTAHNNLTLFQGYLSANQASIPATAYWSIRFDTESIDTGNCYDSGDWYGTAAAYLSSDADSDATHIQDDDATFTAWVNYAFVQWTDSADANPGTGYVTAWDVDTLTIVKASGADFTASGKYYIRKGHYTVPTTGTYVVSGCCRIATTEADKRYAFGLRSAVAPYGNADLTQHVSHNVQASMAAAMTPTWTTIIHLTAGHLVQWIITPVGLAAAYTVAGDAVQPYYTWGAIYMLRVD